MMTEPVPVLFSFLGTGDYKPTCYALPGDPAGAIKTPFVAIALARLYGADDVVMFATEKAEDTNGKLLRDAFAASGMTEPCFQPLPNGQHTSELWDAFDRIRKNLEQHADRPVLFDITHGFRAQPFFAAAVIAYLRGLGRGPNDLRVVYGAFEARDAGTNVTPIWDLTTFADLIDWSNALERLIATGDADGVAGRAETLGRRLARDWAVGDRRGPRPELERLGRALRGFGDALATVRLGELLLGRPRCSGGGNGSCAEELLHNIETTDLPFAEVDTEQTAETYFITRHPGARAWAEQEGFPVDAVLENLDVETIRPGDIVIGSLPVNLAAEVCARGGRYLHLTLPLPPELRGKELTAEDMRRLGARVEGFRVLREG